MHSRTTEQGHPDSFYYWSVIKAVVLQFVRFSFGNFYIFLAGLDFPKPHHSLPFSIPPKPHSLPPTPNTIPYLVMYTTLTISPLRFVCVYDKLYAFYSKQRFFSRVSLFRVNTLFPYGFVYNGCLYLRSQTLKYLWLLRSKYSQQAKMKNKLFFAKIALFTRYPPFCFLSRPRPYIFLSWEVINRFLWNLAYSLI